MSKPIYYLVSVGNDEEYIMAISFDREILENMIQEHPELDEGYKLVIKEHLKIFQIYLQYDDQRLYDKYVFMHVNYPSKTYDYTNLYAFNMTKRIDHGLDFEIENGIIDLHCYHDKVNKIPLLKDNISANPILFDTYYEEGIMNA